MASVFCMGLPWLDIDYGILTGRIDYVIIGGVTVYDRWNDVARLGWEEWLISIIRYGYTYNPNKRRHGYYAFIRKWIEEGKWHDS